LLLPHLCCWRSFFLLGRGQDDLLWPVEVYNIHDFFDSFKIWYQTIRRHFFVEDIGLQRTMLIAPNIKESLNETVHAFSEIGDHDQVFIICHISCWVSS